MIDVNTGKLTLAKVVRRHTFVEGRSDKLARVHVARMDDDSVRVIMERRRGAFLKTTPLVISFEFRRRNRDAFMAAVEFVRDQDARFITSETTAWR